MVQTHRHDTTFWRLMSTGLWFAAMMAIVIAGLGNPTGLGLLFDVVVYGSLGTIAVVLASFLAAFILSMLYMPVPRLFAGSLLCTGMTAYIILYLDKLGILFSAVIAAGYTLLAVMGAFSVSVMLIRKKGWLTQAAISLLPIVLVCTYVSWPKTSGFDVAPTFSDGKSIAAMPSFQAENPANPGPYDFHYFTYGNGQDKHRKEFGSQVDYISDSVDASGYIDEWPRLRTLFWGFDERALPLNGRVWMPEGQGPFPLVLIVHGNHTMEYFSDGGYAYLGELLASRGFITISVDQNFLNYSNWSGIPKEDRKLRAWLLLHHLLQIKKFQESPDTPFYKQVDWQQIALIGHSRGGQAAAMAADYRSWFRSDESLTGIEDIHIQAVVGLAPTDKKIEGKYPHLKDTYYLVLHGARDADVINFHGERQYERTTFSEHSERFKASLYIADANHSQFNTEWGRMDISLPGGLFLNRRQTMEPAAQREITKIYISAFLETALNGNRAYRPLFQDYRLGHRWLPDTQFVSRFESADSVLLVDFERDHEENLTIEADGFSTWEVQSAKDRQGRQKGTNGVLLEWDTRGTYTLIVHDSFRERLFNGRKAERLFFSMANMESNTEGEEENGSDQAASTGTMSARVDIEIETKDGHAVRLSLDQFMPVLPPIETQYTTWAWFDEIMKKGKYRHATEPVFQTYELPLSAFEQNNPHFQFEEMNKITFYFSGKPGKVMIDQIGFGGI